MHVSCQRKAGIPAYSSLHIHSLLAIYHTPNSFYDTLNAITHEHAMIKYCQLCLDILQGIGL